MNGGSLEVRNSQVGPCAKAAHLEEVYRARMPFQPQGETPARIAE